MLGRLVGKTEIGYPPAGMADMTLAQEGSSLRGGAEGGGSPAETAVELQVADAVLEKEQKGVLIEEGPAEVEAGLDIIRLDAEQHDIDAGEAVRVGTGSHRYCFACSAKMIDNALSGKVFGPAAVIVENRQTVARGPQTLCDNGAEQATQGSRTYQ
jgi:hypothetical protein